MRSVNRENGSKQQRNKIFGNIFGNRANESSSSSWRNATTGYKLPLAASTRLTDSTTTSFLQRSTSADNVQIIRQRGFKPSDRHDPAKRRFLENLTSKILHFDMESSGNSTPIDLQKLLTPATDSNQTLHVQRNKKMYASSYFYAPSHPTVEDQVELARRISSSLSDVKNVKSKGQSMYVNRKKRSVKWIHDGNGQEDEEEPSSPASPSQSKEKIPLKCMMNPSGKLLDYRGIQALGEEPNIPQVPPHPERLYDIVRDLNNQKGRGAEIFAKRRKRSEKWIVDAEQPQSASIYGYGKAPAYPIKQGIGVNEQLKFDDKSCYNPFDLSMDYSNSSVPNCGHRCSRAASFSSAHSDCGPCNGHEVKKIYLREIAVGTEPDKLLRRPNNYNPIRSCHSNGTNGRSAISTRNNNHQNGGAHYQHHSHGSRSNGYHPQMHNGYNYLNGHNHHHHQQQQQQQQQQQHHHHHHRHRQSASCGAGYFNGGNAGYQNGYQTRNHCQNVNDYENGNGYGASPSASNEENPVEDYTPVPVKQLIQEFEKTCRPVMQFKQYPSRSASIVNNNNQNDLSRYFESRRQVVYHNRQQQSQQRNQYRANGGYASSAGDDEQDDDVDENDEDDEDDDEDDDNEVEEVEEEDDDDDASLDDSLSPVDFCRVDERSLLGQRAANNLVQKHTNNRSSSMSTIDEYYRRQLQQYPSQQSDKSKFIDTEAELPIGVRAANLAAVASQPRITAQKKDLRKTPVLENLVAGTTTPECFKQTFTEEIATKLNDNEYHGPKISSYQNLTNYNTAPRGWDQSQKVYRPIRFEKPQDAKISYSDF